MSNQGLRICVESGPRNNEHDTMWFRNLQYYRLSRFEISAEMLQAALADHALQPVSGGQTQHLGWLPPKGDHHPYAHQYGQQRLLSLGVERKLLPAGVINQFVKARAVELEEQQGFKPGRKQLKQLKEAVTDELLPRAFALRRSTWGWIDPEGRWLAVDAGSLAKADEFIGMLMKTVDGLVLKETKTQLSPSGAMTQWLASGEAPAGFTLDDICELRGSGDGKSSVRYTGDIPEAGEIRKHIESGKQVTKLALTWRDKISFVLDEHGQIKRLRPLDVLTEQADADDEVFDSDFALMSGELGKLLTDLVSALGGETESP